MLLAVSLSLLACAGPTGAADLPAPAPVAASSAEPPAAGVAVRDVDVATLQTDLARGAVPLLIDVRSAEEFAGGHVPGAKNVPLDALEGRLAELGAAGTPLYVICQSGRRSASASATLASKGYTPVNVLGGTSAWQAAGYAVE